MNKILQEHNIDYIDIPFLNWKDKKFPDSAIGCYLNFLEIGNLMLIDFICKLYANKKSHKHHCLQLFDFQW